MGPGTPLRSRVCNSPKPSPGGRRRRSGSIDNCRASTQLPVPAKMEPVIPENTTDLAATPASVPAPGIEPAAPPVVSPEDGPPPRGTIAEWTITILLLLFLTTFLVQAFVIPTGSMEDTLLVGDHLLVDKLSYAPSGPISRHFLPYTEPKRGDIIVFRYPVDITQTFVKRCMGVPGDRIRMVNKQVYLNGVRLDEPYKYNKTDYIDSYRDNFPSEPNLNVDH